MDTPHQSGPGGLLAASGVATLVSLMPALTDIFQFISAFVGAFFAILAMNKWIRNKLKERNQSKPPESNE